MGITRKFPSFYVGTGLFSNAGCISASQTPQWSSLPRKTNIFLLMHQRPQHVHDINKQYRTKAPQPLTADVAEAHCLEPYAKHLGLLSRICLGSCRPVLSGAGGRISLRPGVWVVSPEVWRGNSGNDRSWAFSVSSCPFRGTFCVSWLAITFSGWMFDRAREVRLRRQCNLDPVCTENLDGIVNHGTRFLEDEGKTWETDCSTKGSTSMKHIVMLLIPYV